MKKLIEVRKNVIGNSEVSAVSARELYLGLGLAVQHWSAWSKTNIEQNEFFSQGVDFIKLPIIGNANTPNPPKDYAISIDFAKHISMMAKTAKGHEYRGYFLELEKTETVKAIPSMSEAANAAVIFAEAMRLPDSGKLMLFETVNKSYGSPMTLPSYAIDSGTQVSGSSRATFSVTHLLKEYGANISPIAFNKLLEEDGLIVTLSRESFSKGKAIAKPYKSVTEKGLAYGKNVTSPQNPRETQPHWFSDSFSELLNKLGL